MAVAIYERAPLGEIAEMTQASERIHAIPCAIGNGQERRQSFLI
jgi:hypothetical protein